ncbi:MULTISPECIES: septal ring lytic transglycosylase RlpA family protein [unclassified Synechococcus]|uniref:septal ring lytic transglycosylase RlpA family protein n=1 Tax=unclassified Synechococcus TaxID=2626047 RepID=UPI002000C7CE|nr:septal ring lytic transglycosylase RlpA family protein [Synechococcus sp. A10-1-5-1]UPM51383.1 septal ring lytic transglycosylase RlpA family protein [Synechococcus sp. A10-1-5-1]
MRRLSLLGGFALLLSGSSNANPVLAIKSPAIPEIPAAKAVALRSLETPGSESEALKKPAAPALPIAAPSAPRVRAVSTGEASWYGPGFYGNRTANGEVFRPGTLTAAHRTLPFGTKVRVTNLWNGRSAIVRINDRGPFHGRRVIDLAHGAASQLGLVSSGIAQVKLEVLQAQ